MAQRVLIFVFSGAVKPVKELEVPFNDALDWYRISPSTWLVRTDESAVDWVERLKPLIGSGRVFVSDVDLKTRWGLHNKDFWEWIDKFR